MSFVDFFRFKKKSKLNETHITTRHLVNDIHNCIIHKQCFFLELCNLHNIMSCVNKSIKLNFMFRCQRRRIGDKTTTSSKHLFIN